MVGRLRALTSKLRSRWDPGVAVLRYHRVADVESDPLAITVSPTHFAEHLDVLKSAYVPMTLRGVIESLHEKPLPRLGVVITFDDGYADNLITATPALSRYDIPATVFVITGYIGREHECWWDTLERVLLRPGRLPERLRVSVRDFEFTWNLGRSAVYGPDEYRRHRVWSWRAGKPPTVRHRLFRQLFRELQRFDESLREAILHELVTWAQAEPGAPPTHRMLTAQEVTRLHKSHLIEVGAHSVTHPVLARLPAPTQKQEIEASKAALEEILGSPVRSFAYPYGDAAGAAALVKQAGFASACTTEDALVRHGQDRYRLPRLYVGNWNGDRFARYLRRWL